MLTVVAQQGSVSFAQFFLIIAALLVVLLVAAIVVARRTQAEDAFRHRTSLGEFSPGVVGNLQERVERAALGHHDATQWLDAFLRDATADAVALRRRIPKDRAVALIDQQLVDDLPETVSDFLDEGSWRRRWRLRRRAGVKPRIPRRFSLRRVILPLYVSRHELILQDVQLLLESLETYANGESS